VQEALEAGLSLIEVSHAQMEDLTMEALAEKIKGTMGLDVVLISGSFEECKLI
jgi:putative NIF3 family GTP cyclohydrolase 1 type 2